LEDCGSKLLSATTENKFLSVEVDQLNIAIVVSEEQKQNLIEDNKDAQSRIDDLKKKSSEMVNALKEKKVEVDVLQKRIRVSTGKTITLNEQLITLKSNMKSVSDEKELLDTELKNLAEKIKVQGEELQLKKNVNIMLAVKCDEIKNEKKQVLDELIDVRQRLEKAQKAGFWRRLFKKY